MNAKDFRMFSFLSFKTNLLLILLTLLGQVFGQDKKLQTEGILEEDEILAIYNGQFQNISAQPGTMAFDLLLNSYVYEKARECTAYLPEDKVELTYQECAEEMVTRDGYGTEISRYCVSWRTVKTGLYTTPELDAAMKVKQGPTQNSAVNMMAEMIREGDPMDFARNTMRTNKTLENDITLLFKNNKCNGNALKLFETNLLNLANGRESISSHFVPTTGAANTEIDYNSQNYASLVEDLILDQSKGWLMNRYIVNSAANVAINKDAQGRPSFITANYEYNGFSGKQKGSVKITFNNGKPECLYFHDYPNKCNQAAKYIVKRYQQNTYARK